MIEDSRPVAVGDGIADDTAAIQAGARLSAGMHLSDNDDLACIRHFYKVPARVGGRVQLGDGFSRELRGRLGTITDANGQYLRIRLDGDMDQYSRPFHPTWELTYLDGGGHG